MKNATSFSFSETEIFDDSKAVKIENITVSRYLQWNVDVSNNLEN